MTTTGVPIARRPAGKGFHTKAAQRRSEARARKLAQPPAPKWPREER